MKKVSLKARFLLLSCLAFSASALSASPAQAQWNFRLAVTGPSAATPTYGDVNGTPLSSSPTPNSLGGINATASKFVVAPPFPSDNFASSVDVQTTITWVGSGPAPTSVALDEQVSGDASVGHPRDRLAGYGNSISFVTSVTGVSHVHQLTDTFARKSLYDEVRITYPVVNGTLTLNRHIASDLVFDSSGIGSIPPSDYPTSYYTSWCYNVRVAETEEL